MASQRTPKRRSKFGPRPKPEELKASKFVGVKMRAVTLYMLDRLVAWAGGRRAGASRSSIIVNLIEETFRRGDPRKQKPLHMEDEYERARKGVKDSEDP